MAEVGVAFTTKWYEARVSNTCDVLDLEGCYFVYSFKTSKQFIPFAHRVAVSDKLYK